MDKPLDDIKEVIYYAIKCEGDERTYERKNPGINRTSKDIFIIGINYADYLRELSVGYLLDGYDKEDVKGMEKLIHKIKGRDILLDTLLNSMIGCEASDEIMVTNYYPKLVDIIKEEDKEKAEDMILEFMKNDWYKNTKRYPFMDSRKPGGYEGSFAYETAAIVKMKGLDYSKFKGLKYFPIDMLYYSEGVHVDVKGNEIFKKSLEFDGKEYEFETNMEDAKDFEQGTMTNPEFIDMTLEGISFAYSSMESMVVKNCKVVGCDFTASNIFGIQFEDSEIVNCTFDQADMEKSGFLNCTLRGNSFKESDIFDASMMFSVVKENNFTEANITNLDLTNTEFRNNNLEMANFAIFRDGRSKQDLESSPVMKFLDTIRLTPYKREVPDQIIEGNNFRRTKIYKKVKFSEYEKDNNDFIDSEIVTD
ncbi:MAG: PoNe immunity protein domain-containing protein [Mycoplasmatales bacterium]